MGSMENIAIRAISVIKSLQLKVYSNNTEEYILVINHMHVINVIYDL